MVGVPGRSKGCLACRKRKIACSQERPECTICVKAGRECPGYQRDRIFVHYVDHPTTRAKIGATNKALVRRPAKRTTPPKEETSGSAPSSSKPPPEEKPDREAVSSLSNRSTASFGTSASTKIIIRPSLTAKSYHQQLLGAFLVRYGLQMQRGTKGVINQHWLSLVPERPQLSRALDAAATAFCTAKLGRACADKSLLAESLKLYGNGLRELQQALWDPRQMYSDDTLGACVLLVMFEIFECPSQSREGYLSHLEGCARLVQARGPRAHVSGMGHSIFASFRFMGALEALRTKHSFLESPDWMTIPFSSGPQSPFNTFIDLLLEAPALIRRGETIAQLPTPAHQLAHALALLKGLWDLENRMRAFYAELEMSIPGELYWTRLSGVESTTTIATHDAFSSSSCEEEEDLFPVHFAFPNTHIAGLLMLYWACLTMLYVGIVHVHGLIQYLRLIVPEANLAAAQRSLLLIPSSNQSSSSSGSSSSNSGSSSSSSGGGNRYENGQEPHDDELDENNCADYAGYAGNFPRALSFSVTGRNVCQSVVYCLEDTSDELSVSAVTAPLQIVRDTFAGWPDKECFRGEIDWIDRVLASVAGRGVGIIRYLTEDSK